MIILKSKHEKIVQDLVNEIADYQKLLYYRSISEQITMGNGVYHSHYPDSTHNVNCLFWNDKSKEHFWQVIGKFPTEYEAYELIHVIKEKNNEVVEIFQTTAWDNLQDYWNVLNSPNSANFEHYEDLFCAWTENIEQILNETKVQRED